MAGDRAARRGSRLLLATVLVTLGGPAIVDAQEAEGRRGQMAVSYQYTEERDLIGATVTVPTNTLTTKAINFQVDYAINDRWSVNAGLPLISRKTLDPNRTHDPLAIIPPHTESQFLDDGHFHTYWQDLRLGASYRAITEPFIVEPYIELSIPVSDYPFFANAAVGQRLRRKEIGTTLAYRPPFLQWYFSWQMGYEDVPPTLGVSIDGVRIFAQATRFLSPRVSLTAFFSSKHSTGTPVPSNPAAIDRTTEWWYYHDRLIRHNYISAGVRTDLALSDRNSLGIEWIRMPHAQDIFKLRKALNITVSRSFGAPTPSSSGARTRLRSTAD